MESNSVWSHSYERLTKSDDREAGVQFVNHEYDYRLNWTTGCPVTNQSKVWQNSRNQQSIDWALNDFKTLLWMLKNPALYSTKCTRTASAKWRALSNYKNDVCNCPINAQIRLLIANHVREFCYSFDFIINSYQWHWSLAVFLDVNFVVVDRLSS